MTQNNNFSVLPFYTQLSEQNHRKSYAYGMVYPLFTPKNTLLPFQILRPHRANSITGASMYNVKGETVYEISVNDLEIGGLTIVSQEAYGFDAIVFPQSAPMTNAIKTEGQYYITLTDGITTWYSEVFTVVDDISPYLMIEWYDRADFYFDSGAIIYTNPTFKNRLYLNTELGKPDYSFEEEGESRDGYFFAEKQISEKTYRCTIIAPEYLCDVMRFIRMSDYVKVRDKYGREYQCEQFTIDPKWQTQGDLASVEIEFQTDTVAKKLGRGYLLEHHGDFNIDFNDDYNNE